ncbi:hypothetical protein [Streptomyces sp. NPDC001876]|uniref:hypothetical protein n=1 Tax=Streptomyces sp. NPDC001876 TaxID=3154402 RepID=UPI003325D05F
MIDVCTFHNRLSVPATVSGFPAEAIEQARSRPEGDTWYAAWVLSDVLAEAGRTEEAAAVLERHPTFNSSPRAERLIDLGRIEDAVQVLVVFDGVRGPERAQALAGSAGLDVEQVAAQEVDVSVLERGEAGDVLVLDVMLGAKPTALRTRPRATSWSYPNQPSTTKSCRILGLRNGTRV